MQSALHSFVDAARYFQLLETPSSCKQNVLQQHQLSVLCSRRCVSQTNQRLWCSQTGKAPAANRTLVRQSVSHSEQLKQAAHPFTMYCTCFELLCCMSLGFQASPQPNLPGIVHGPNSQQNRTLNMQLVCKWWLCDVRHNMPQHPQWPLHKPSFRVQPFQQKQRVQSVSPD